MDTIHSKWFRAVLFLALVYLVIGFGFAELANNATSIQMLRFWRIAAWVVSFLGFLGHISYDHVMLHNSVLATAFHTSLAAAIASFGLALAANIHAQFVTSSNPTMLALSLMLWPLLTMIPAFGVAFIISFALARWWRKS